MGKGGGNTMFRIVENDEIIFETDNIQKLIEYIEREEDFNPKFIQFYASQFR